MVAWRHRLADTGEREVCGGAAEDEGIGASPDGIDLSPPGSPPQRRYAGRCPYALDLREH